MSRVNQELVGHHHHRPDVAAAVEKLAAVSAAVDKLAVAVESVTAATKEVAEAETAAADRVVERASLLRRRRWPG